jgi:hypothetical protein
LRVSLAGSLPVKRGGSLSFFMIFHLCRSRVIMSPLRMKGDIFRLKSAWHARRQHSYNICKDFLSHNSWMKNFNFTNSCTINMNWNIYTIFIQLKTTFFEKSVSRVVGLYSSNCRQFFVCRAVNWELLGQFTSNFAQLLELINSCTINMNWNIYTIFIQLKTTFFEKSVKFEVNWWRGSQFTARHTKNRLQFDE